MAVLSIQTVIPSGLPVSYANSAAEGDEFVNDGQTFLAIRNQAGTAISVVIPTTATLSGYPLADQTIPVSANATVFAGPFGKSLFDNSSGRVSVQYSSVTSVSIAALRLRMG